METPKSVWVYAFLTLNGTNGTPGFFDRMIDANRVLLTLDSLDSKADALAVALVTNEAALVHAQLTVLQDSPFLTPLESVELQTVIDQIRAKLRFFGRFV